MNHINSKPVTDLEARFPNTKFCMTSSVAVGAILWIFREPSAASTSNSSGLLPPWERFGLPGGSAGGSSRLLILIGGAVGHGSDYREPSGFPKQCGSLFTTSESAVAATRANKNSGAPTRSLRTNPRPAVQALQSQLTW